MVKWELSHGIVHVKMANFISSFFKNKKSSKADITFKVTGSDLRETPWTPGSAVGPEEHC